MTGIDIRCRVCTKKLAEGVFVRLSIKCQRCKTLNLYERHQRAPFLEKSGDKLTPKKNISSSDLRVAALALATAQKMEAQSVKDSTDELMSDARDWFLADKARTIQATADKFGLKYSKVRQRAHGDGWFETRERIHENRTDQGSETAKNPT